MFYGVRKMRMNKSFIINALVVVCIFLLLVVATLIVVSQLGGRQAFFTEEPANNGENIVAYYDFIIGLPLTVITSLIAVLLAWIALTVSTKQHRVEVIQFYLALSDSYKTLFDNILSDLREQNQSLRDATKNLSQQAYGQDDWNKVGKIDDFNAVSCAVLCGKNYSEFLSDIRKEHRDVRDDQSKSPKWDEFINECLSKVDEKFWKNSIEFETCNELFEIIRSKEHNDHIGDALGNLEEVDFEKNTLSLIFQLARSFGYVGGTGDCTMTECWADEYIFDEYLVYKPSENNQRTPFQSLFQLVPTDRVFSVIDVNSYRDLYHQYEPTRSKLIRISGFDQYIVSRTLYSSQCVTEYNRIIQEYTKLKTEFSELVNSGPESFAVPGIERFAKRFLEMEQTAMSNKISSHLQEMSVLLRGIFDVDDKIVVEGVLMQNEARIEVNGTLLDNDLRSDTISRKELNYSFGFSSDVIDIVRGHC